MPATVAQLAEAIGSGVSTCTSVIEDALNRVEELNPSIGAIVTPAPDALDRARHLDATGASGPLVGVPFTVKDVIATAGMATTAGSRSLADFVPTWTAPAVQRLIDAGAVLMGKANCPEFAYDMHTRNDLFGSTDNPLFPGLTVGGSSGGDAAAVASGMAAFAIGTDLGGSIRWPAACLGLVGMRPTVGLVPGAGQLPFPQSGVPEARSPVSFRGLSQTISPLAHTVADVWSVLSVMAGPDHLDSHSVPVALGDPELVNLGALEVGWCSDEVFFPLRDDVRRALLRALGDLRATGTHVLDTDTAWLAPAAQCFADIRRAEGLEDFRELVAGREHLLSERMTRILAADRDDVARFGSSVDRYFSAGAWRERIRSRVLRLLDSTPVILLPISPVPPFSPAATTITVDSRELPAESVLDVCRAVTLLGFPAISVPCGTTDDGLPVNIQVVARPFHDHEAIAVAAQLERNRTS
jgi:Asp-tRNA(Asn)/Glu-tRNA(Gln) amidotransferase A subunit family amidase